MDFFPLFLQYMSYNFDNPKELKKIYETDMIECQWNHPEEYG